MSPYIFRNPYLTDDFLTSRSLHIMMARFSSAEAASHFGVAEAMHLMSASRTYHCLRLVKILLCECLTERDIKLS